MTVNRDSLTVNRKWVHGYFWFRVKGEGQLMVNGSRFMVQGN